jgi:Short C-terminal domain
MILIGCAIEAQCMVPLVGLFSRKRKDPDLEDLPPEAAAIVEQLRDVFPDAAISVDDPVEVNVQDILQGTGVDGGGDRISQLERLARLREQGALTEAEFQAEKARVLGEG